MKKPITNYGHSVRMRLLDLANRKHVQFEYMLLRYALERFLYRLGASEYANRFVLKGASAFAVWMGQFCRVTRDADLETIISKLAKFIGPIISRSASNEIWNHSMSEWEISEIKEREKR